ncbi:MAG: o-succinylbenzoate synthase [Paenisporosarcina sp.]
MVNIHIQRVALYHVRVPLKKSFITHLQHVNERESIFIELTDSDGHTGVGECVSFTSPWYTEETVQTSWEMLESWIIPAIFNQSFSHPDELDSCLSFIKGNHMAKATVNHAMWDLFAIKEDQPLWQIIGGASRPIEAGTVVATATEEKMIREIDAAVDQGYKRIKIKITPKSNPDQLKKIIDQYPQTLFSADANGAFTENTISLLHTFDDCGFALIEQPFSEQYNNVSAIAQKTMKTPFALDESITSLSAVEEMRERQSGKIVVMKQGRVGGLSNALRIHDYCINAGIPIFVGGMIEFGVSKAFNIAFATLPGVQFPGDFSSSTHFWNEDLAKPPITVHKGEIQLSNLPGVGVALNHEIMGKYEVRKKEFFAK